ncbi:hypothetical protein ACJJI3_01430 [Microbulbifer sp. ZKSA004]|uniref:hypothetical protein n=1 Tax=Microbulbifer sp. ZKSA004 TaxID=3243389 RepID=UPI00403970CB
MPSWGNTELTRNQQSALFEPSPCDACKQRDRCAVEELACSDYLRWQDTGKARYRDREPTSKIFQKIFKVNQ